MKLFIFLTFAFSYIVLCEAYNTYMAYCLTLGPLEFFLKLDKEDVANCYNDYIKNYKQTIITFSEKISKVRSDVYRTFPSDTADKNLMVYSLNEAKYVYETLNYLLKELDGKISSKKLWDGGKDIYYQRLKLEDHYSQYEKHKTNLRNRIENTYGVVIPITDAAFKELLKESQELVKNVLKCCESKDISYVWDDA